MSFELQLPVRDPAEVVTAATIGELPAHLDDPDERVIASELLAAARLAAMPAQVTVGQLVELLEELPADERRELLDACGRRGGLASLDRREFEHQHQFRAPFEDMRPALELREGRWVERSPEARLAFNASGGIVDLDEIEIEAARQRTAAESRDRQAQVRRADAEAEAAALAAHQEAMAEQMQRELPEGVRL